MRNSERVGAVGEFDWWEEVRAGKGGSLGGAVGRRRKIPPGRRRKLFYRASVRCHDSLADALSESLNSYSARGENDVEAPNKSLDGR